MKIEKKAYIIIGAYGSGKSEYSINLAKDLRDRGEEVILADLDVVNPYFRSRDVRDEFAKMGIEVISPQGEYSHADLPMLSPRIMGAVQDWGKQVILDVGGDPAGCRILARFVDNLVKRGYEMKMVVNTKRPFTNSVDNILYMIDSLQKSSQLNITELICNTNLLSETTTEMITDGVRIIAEAAEKTQKVFNEFLVMGEGIAGVPDEILGKRKIVLSYFLKKPWEMPILRGI
ncbi:MAG: hypothetical protein PHR06_07465 [Candidatus Cloacimonetes bacterium]|nr:hypothetical protein [Candidatus Cloacimonadota bacterium]